ncbi:MAG: divergent polysaccharide deacetylase family protein [Gammaproteobacteria bacterium]|jgi:uncharacterized protein
MYPRQACLGLACLLLLFLSTSLRAEPARHPLIAIIIDDLGYNLAAGQASLALPGALTVSVLPDTPFARRLADEAHARDKEVMLHLPMESDDDRRLGPDGLTLDMDETQMKRTVQKALADIPYVRGVNNHMGSLLTQHPGDMAWVMQVLQQHGGLYFIDSRTTPRTVAEQVAAEHGLPHAARNVFLDAKPGDPAYVAHQFDTLIQIARARGYAIAIGHPHPATLMVLRERLRNLASDGVTLVHASQLIRAKQEARSWFASLSP